MTERPVRTTRWAAALATTLLLSGAGLACSPPDPGIGTTTTTTEKDPKETTTTTTEKDPKETTTTTSTTTSTTTTSLPTQSCNDATNSGGPGVTITAHELGRTSGSFQIEWDMYSVPDALTVTYEGVEIFSTGGPVSGSGSAMVNFGPGAATNVVVTVTGPTGTLWEYLVRCPVD